jgi:hypothetical protein
MARLQVVYLPSETHGRHKFEPRFALVADQAGELSEGDREALRVFAVEAGAQGFVAVSGVLDVDQGEDDDAEAVEELGGLLQDALAAPVSPEQQKPKLPPVTTTEGRFARTWGGRKPTDQGDPQ